MQYKVVVVYQQLKLFAGSYVFRESSQSGIDVTSPQFLMRCLTNNPT